MEFTWPILSRQTLNQRLAALIPVLVRYAHKTGTIGGTRNDCGIFYFESARWTFAPWSRIFPRSPAPTRPVTRLWPGRCWPATKLSASNPVARRGQSAGRDHQGVGAREQLTLQNLAYGSALPLHQYRQAAGEYGRGHVPADLLEK
ncbi:MAG: serine hydrolase [Bacillota bacterium]